MGEESLRELVKNGLWSLVIPAGLAALNVPWPAIFAITLMLWLFVAAAAYQSRRTPILVLVVVSGVGAGWAVRYYVDYRLTFQLCRNQKMTVLDGEPRILAYAVGIRPLNNNGVDLWIDVEQEDVSLGGKTSTIEGPKPASGPSELERGQTHEAIWDKFLFFQPSYLEDASHGHLRYVVRYGKDADHLDKRLIVSGTFDVEYPPQGDTFITMQRDSDSAAPVTERLCRLPLT